MNRKQAIIYLSSPMQFVSAVCALRSIHKDNLPNVLLIVHWPGMKTELLKEITVIINIFNTSFKDFLRVLQISTEEINNIIQSRKFQRDFKIYFSFDNVNEIYYAHDIDGGFCQLLFNVYPDARRICYGDSLGLVYEKHALLSQLNVKNIRVGKISTLVTKVKSFIKGDKVGSLSDLHLKELPADEAVLILPVDQSGNFLNNISLTVCKKELFQDIFSTCLNNATELNQYISALLYPYLDKKKYLILTENFSEAGFTNFEKEIEMWCFFIRKYCIKNSVVILKAHPGEVFKRNAKIIEKLDSEFDIIEVESKYKRYPIELWKELIEQTEIICAAYPVFSLKYIYNIDVIQPMDNQLIEQWFEPWAWNNLKNAISLFMLPAKNLLTWDGNSVLYKGNIKLNS